jgi:hypothetical protein
VLAGAKIHYETRAGHDFLTIDAEHISKKAQNVGQERCLAAAIRDQTSRVRSLTEITASAS